MKASKGPKPSTTPKPNKTTKPSKKVLTVIQTRVSLEPTPFAIICKTDGERGGCGTVYLTHKEYARQLTQANVRWECPKCGKKPVIFDDDHLEAWNNG